MTNATYTHPTCDIAAFGNSPFVVLLQQDGSDETDHRRVVGEDPDHVRAAHDLFVDPLERVRGRDLAPMRPRERCVRGHVTFGASEDLGSFGEPVFEHVHDCVELGAGGLRVGLCVDRTDGRCDHVLVSVVHGRQDVAHEMNLAALPAGTCEHSGDRCFQPGMGV